MAAERVAEAVTGRGAVPALAFRVAEAGVLEHAAAPTLRFGLAVTAADGESIRGVALTTQIRIAAHRRAYARPEQARLAELFGAPSQWGRSLRSLFWTQTTTLVPPFTGGTSVVLPVACTYDFDVAAAKYFHALDDGEIPLEFLFSGSVYYDGGDGRLQAGRITWDAETRGALPVRVWRAMMELYFPNSAWLRLRRDTFDRLHAYRIQRALPTWEAAIDALLGGSEA